MPRSVDYVIEAGHDIEVPVPVEVASVPGGVVARRGGDVAGEELAIVVVDGRHEGGRQRQPNADFAQLAGRQRLVVAGQDGHPEAGARHGRAAGLGLESMQVEVVAGR